MNYCASPYFYQRRVTREIVIGDPARGGVILHILNGQLMALLVDYDPASSNNVSGIFGLQIEGVPCKVSFRNLWLRKLN